MSPNGEMFLAPEPMAKALSAIDPKDILETGDNSAAVSEGYLPTNPTNVPLPRFVAEKEAVIEIPAMSAEDGDAEEEPIAAGEATDEVPGADRDFVSPIEERMAPNAYKPAPEVFSDQDVVVMEDDEDEGKKIELAAK